MSDQYYRNKIKVVGCDMMCFPVHPVTLDALSCGGYDPYAWCDPEVGPIETISVSEWQDRREAQWQLNRI